jgi:hypothetical protein
MQTAEKATPLKPTRASFVRGLPEDMPIEEVIERAREVGLELKPSDIHSARYYMRQAAAGQTARAEKGPLRSAPASSVFAVTPRTTEGNAATATANARPEITVIPRVREPVVKPRQPVVKSRAKREQQKAQKREQREQAQKREQAQAPSPRARPESAASLEKQVRAIAMRLGTERVRAILEEIERMKL